MAKSPFISPSLSTNDEAAAKMCLRFIIPCLAAFAVFFIALAYAFIPTREYVQLIHMLQHTAPLFRIEVIIDQVQQILFRHHAELDTATRVSTFLTVVYVAPCLIVSARRAKAEKKNKTLNLGQ